MTPPEPTGDPFPSAIQRIWLKYVGAIGLAALALLAGLSGIGPWPESGFVSGLILLATGPFFALRLAAVDATRPERTERGSVWRALPWATAALGLVELAVTFTGAINHP